MLCAKPWGAGVAQWRLRKERRGAARAEQGDGGRREESARLIATTFGLRNLMVFDLGGNRTYSGYVVQG